MTDTPNAPTEHCADPATISIGSHVTFTCPSCEFSFVHTWLVSDGSQFGDSFCYMHDPKVEMFITHVLPPSEGETDE